MGGEAMLRLESGASGHGHAPGTTGSWIRGGTPGALLFGFALLAPPVPATAQLFEAADRCVACHSGVVAPSGEDVSIGTAWRATMMANSGRDPYWQAAVRREILDRPMAQERIEDECSVCHMPMMRTEAHAAGVAPSIFQHLPGDRGDERADVLAADGVSCSACHQIQAEGLGTPASFTGGYRIATGPGERTAFGPFEPTGGLDGVMRSATGFRPRRADHIQSSELCATCHTLITEALDAQGNVVGRLPEQVPFLEWKASSYVESASCQTCHMPVVRDSVPVTGVLGLPRAEVSRHTFVGGNAFMMRMLNRNRDALAVAATDAEMDAAIRRTEQHLSEATARLRLENVTRADGRVEFDVGIEVLAGHKFPTAYPSRRAWLHVRVLDDADRVLFESGALGEDGRIAGNDNDADGTRFEPHHVRIDSPDQVQIYEAILTSPDGQVTTGLLTASGYAKDNRLLPHGFDKMTAEPDVAVHGAARADGDFTAGGDGVRYSVPAAAAGDVRVEVRLLFQPIGWRWANNLAEYASAETDRFVAMFRAMADVSATEIATASMTLR